MINKKLQKALGIGALVLTLGIGTAGCKREAAQTKTEPKRIEIKVGENRHDEAKPWTRLSTYCGMNNEKTFSVSHGGYSAVNFYYPADSKEIKFGDEKYRVIEVTPEHIILDYLGKVKEK